MKRDDIWKTIIEKIQEVIPELEDYAFQPGDRLADLGANSVDRVEIIMLTMDSLSLKVPMVEFAGAKNIGELADVFHEKLQST